ncbi:Uu.00g091340.m01.CDS01 [Anthostomella pinea]|uniref:Uu.00g091340.m01.CDS01 n=1 Tax=Anthostomella pinea TaxID=933095 RepID=A0AAI8VN55_9PEZI|nr:Uu.00g091340.m01.CDS01 [Anthostomella pinea]
MHLTTAAILLALGSVAVADIEGCAIANGDEQKCTIQSLGPKGHPDLSSATCG